MVARVTDNTLTPLTPYAVLMDTRCLRAPSHNWKKLSALFTSAYHHWISGVGFPTISQYSSKVSPVSLVSERGDFTNPAEGRHRDGKTGKTWEIKRWEEKKGQWKGSGWKKRKNKLKLQTKSAIRNKKCNNYTMRKYKCFYYIFVIWLFLFFTMCKKKDPAIYRSAIYF